MAGPTRTTNKIHFTDLEPGRFEDLCLAIIFPMHSWSDIRHYGRTGTDGGVDIHAQEKMEDGVERRWFVQCRRYATATKRTLEIAIDDALANAGSMPPQVLLVVVACDVRRDAHENFVSYAASKGVATPLLWTASVLEARLHNERHDLLFTYFGISMAREARTRERAVVRNIALKKRLQRELFKSGKDVDWRAAIKDPHIKFISSKMIIHSVDDVTYPNADDKTAGISGWFRLEPWNMYHNGLEFIMSVDYVIMNEDGAWAEIKYGETFDEIKYTKVKTFLISQIPYENIVEIDLDGDKYYNEPHIYCRFSNSGTPYEGFHRVLLEESYPHKLNSDAEFKRK